MADLHEKLSIAKRLIDDLPSSDSHEDVLQKCVSQIYPFTTENLKAELEPFDLTRKDVLTVMGSGDQVFEYFLKGARSIDTFDSNPLTEPYYYLKYSCILSGFSKKDYFSFFSSRVLKQLFKEVLNDQVFDGQAYDKISPFLKGDHKRFWDVLMMRYGKTWVRKPNRLFSSDEEGYENLKKMLNYAEDEQYHKLQSNISKLSINFLNFSLEELPYHLKKQYDFINLSNIVRFIDYMWTEKTLEEFKKVTDSLIPFLKKDGTLVVGYLFDYTSGSEKSPVSIYHPNLRNQYYPSDIYDYYQFLGVKDMRYNDYTMRCPDGILVYQKKCS